MIMQSSMDELDKMALANINKHHKKTRDSYFGSV